MQIAAQVKKAPADSRKCRGHNGNHFVPVSMRNGRWVYYWLTLSQVLFWRTRKSNEKAELARSADSECFVCALQQALEKETLFED